MHTPEHRFPRCSAPRDYPLRLGIHSTCELALRTQTAQVVLLPIGRQVGTFFLVKWVPNVLECATRETFSGELDRGAEESLGQSAENKSYKTYWTYIIFSRKTGLSMVRHQ